MINLKKIVLLFTGLLLMTANSVSQNISINENGADPDNTAMLDVSATDKGILIPRMTAAQRLAIPSPANGLLVFQTDVPRGFYAYFAANTVWTRLSVDTTLNLERVLNGGNNANNDSIVNLGALGVGVSNPVGSIQIDSFAIIQGKPYNSFRWFGFNGFYDGISANPERIFDGKAAIFAQGAGRTTIGHFGFGTAGSPLGDALASIEFRDSSISLVGEALDFEINLGGNTFIDSLRIANNYSFPRLDGSANQVLRTDGSGNLNWSTILGDNLGSHSATTNIQLNGNYLSNDGGNEGIRISNTGEIGIGIGNNQPTGLIQLADNIAPSLNEGVFIDLQNYSANTGSLVGIRFKNSLVTNNTRNQAAIFHRNIFPGGYQLNFAVRDNSVGDNVDTADIKMTITDVGRVGINTVNPSNELDVNGDVSADNYLYNTPQTRYYTIGETEFRMARLDGEISSTFGVGGVGIINSTGFNALVTPVHLPDGAIVTAVEAYYVDNSVVGNMTFYLDRRTLNGSLNTLFTGTTSGVSVTVQSLNLTGTPSAIDNSSNSYGIRVYSADWPSTAVKDMSIRTVRITYTVTETD